MRVFPIVPTVHNQGHSTVNPRTGKPRQGVKSVLINSAGDLNQEVRGE